MIYRICYYNGEEGVTDEVGSWAALQWPGEEVLILPWVSLHLTPSGGKKPCTSMNHYQVREVRKKSDPKQSLVSIFRAHDIKTINAIPNPYHHATETIQTTAGGGNSSSAKPKPRTKPRASHRVGKKYSDSKRRRNLQ